MFKISAQRAAREASRVHARTKNQSQWYGIPLVDVDNGIDWFAKPNVESVAASLCFSRLEIDVFLWDCASLHVEGCDVPDHVEFYAVGHNVSLQQNGCILYRVFG